MIKWIAFQRILVLYTNQQIKQIQQLSKIKQMNIFTPFPLSICEYYRKNRIVLAPMTIANNDDGTLGNDEYRWLVRSELKSRGLALNITCAANITKKKAGKVN
ncbi:MAG: hypothetical protein IPO92_17460 [Saprospiraceae bacterium]|nr:hypothetical protein [Saprospiraceae bacterium]